MFICRYHRRHGPTTHRPKSIPGTPRPSKTERSPAPPQPLAQALAEDPRPDFCDAASDPHHRRHCAGRRRPRHGEPRLPCDPQADRNAVPSERRAQEDAGGDLAAIRIALPGIFHSQHHARTAGGAGPGRGRGRSGRAHLLAVAIGLAAVRNVQARVQRRRHVPDDRCDVCRRQALLHPPTCRHRRKPLGRLGFMLVHGSVYSTKTRGHALLAQFRRHRYDSGQLRCRDQRGWRQSIFLSGHRSYPDAAEDRLPDR